MQARKKYNKAGAHQIEGGCLLEPVNVEAPPLLLFVCDYALGVPLLRTPYCGRYSLGAKAR